MDSHIARKHCYYTLYEKYLGVVEDDDGEMHVVIRGTQCNDGKPYNLTLYAGTACNIGLLTMHKRRIDSTISFDENLQNFIEDIMAKN